MDTLSIGITRAEARGLYRDYKRHLHHSDPIDRECMRAYQLLAQGRLVIRAIESVRNAGMRSDDGFPKLALCTATAKGVALVLRANGSATMLPTGHARMSNSRGISSVLFNWPAGSFPIGSAPNRWQTWNVEAIVPQCPLHLRPQRGLQNYHVLFEAEWRRVPPTDPYLLRRIGKADLWLVVAQWELTDVEKGALQTRISVM